MKFYIKRKKHNIDAVAEYIPETGEFIVLENSKVSDAISQSVKFRGVKAVREKREANVDDDNLVVKNVVFKSPSTAGNFVTGFSTNGLDAWKDENGRSFKEIVGAKK